MSFTNPHTQKRRESFTILLQVAKVILQWKSSAINVLYQKLEYMIKTEEKRLGGGGEGGQKALNG